MSMAVDDATTDSQQTRKETPHKNNMKANVNDTCETLIRDMMKDIGSKKVCLRERNIGGCYGKQHW